MSASAHVSDINTTLLEWDLRFSVVLNCLHSTASDGEEQTKDTAPARREFSGGFEKF